MRAPLKMRTILLRSPWRLAMTKIDMSVGRRQAKLQ
jgi:hypothetical protein